MGAQEMSFWDHLEELRWMLFRIIIALAVFAIAAFCFMPFIFDEIIMAPTKTGFFLYTYMCKLSGKLPFLPDFCDDNFSVDMINFDLTAQFFRHLSTSGWVALILICPYILFELWRFISPALYEHEKKNIRWVFLFGSIMFFIGCLIGYSIIFPMTLRFLYNYSLSDVIRNEVSLSSYMDNFLTLILIMGLVFEMPLISWLLSQIGILKKSFFKKYRRHAILLLLIAAAIITPTGDPFTLSLVFLPLYGLYEMSIFLVKSDPKETAEF
ncbi:MAG: twin-arginine translocase subunit TatC [Candidatus Symbiothrix sp.]|jgi:sec-independent protein translocase protein TatC|nr:twin-arginine translocase subunit TatC [Candidatus Symbiothrix sp.]